MCATTLGEYRRDHSCFDGQRFRPIRSAAIERIRDTGWGWSQMTLQDRRGGWWIPTSEGLLRFAPGPVSSLTTARPASTYTRRQGLRSDSIFRLFEDSRGGIWVATYAEGANGLARIDPVTGAVARVRSARWVPGRLRHPRTPWPKIGSARYGLGSMRADCCGIATGSKRFLSGLFNQGRARPATRGWGRLWPIVRDASGLPARRTALAVSTTHEPQCPRSGGMARLMACRVIRRG